MGLSCSCMPWGAFSLDDCHLFSYLCLSLFLSFSFIYLDFCFSFMRFAVMVLNIGTWLLVAG